MEMHFEGNTLSPIEDEIEMRSRVVEVDDTCHHPPPPPSILFGLATNDVRNVINVKCYSLYLGNKSIFISMREMLYA